MNTVSPERMKEIEETKEAVKSMNVDSVANLLIKVQNELHALKTDNIDMKRMLTTAKQDNIEMRAEVNALKHMGFVGITGHGSTVHNKEE